ncbi:hypothetical protein DL93DRAFT_1845276 [Clavulina sp. PMI_390]|nr:hypothetical protein DL93DRAFT_1845276 [Clavulina sp. PMI_390]
MAINSVFSIAHYLITDHPCRLSACPVVCNSAHNLRAHMKAVHVPFRRVPPLSRRRLRRSKWTCSIFEPTYGLSSLFCFRSLAKRCQLCMNGFSRLVDEIRHVCGDDVGHGAGNDVVGNPGGEL